MRSTAKSNSVTGLIVSVADRGEKDRLAQLVTEEGRLFVTFKGVRSQQAKLKALAAPFVYGEFVTVGSTVTGGRVLDAHNGFSADVTRAAAGSMIAEAFLKVAEEGGELKAELPLTLVALKTAETAGTFPFTASLWYFLKLFRLEGADTEEYPFNAPTRRLFSVLETLSPTELDAIEASEGEMIAGISAAAKVFDAAFSIRLNSVKEALKLFKPQY